jgi:hypothetical protein
MVEFLEFALRSMEFLDPRARGGGGIKLLKISYGGIVGVAHFEEFLCMWAVIL